MVVTVNFELLHHLVVVLDVLGGVVLAVETGVLGVVLGVSPVVLRGTSGDGQLLCLVRFLVGPAVVFDVLESFLADF